MKISKQRLKQIIKEELSTINELEQLPAEGGGKGAPEDPAAKSTSELAKFLLNVSRQVQAGKVKGLDPAEISQFAGLVTKIVEWMSGSSASTKIKVLNKKVDQLAGTK